MGFTNRSLSWEVHDRDFATNGFVMISSPNATANIAAAIVTIAWMLPHGLTAAPARADISHASDRHVWTFERDDDTDADAWPDRWQRRNTVGYPTYVIGEIAGRDEELQQLARDIDASLTRGYQKFKRLVRNTPAIADRLPPLLPSVADGVVDHHLRVTMDGGRFQAQSPVVPAGPTYQYQLRCELMCRGLNYDSAFVELVFVDEKGNELATKPTSAVRGTTPWTIKIVRSIRAPAGTVGMFLRTNVVGDADGREDIHAVVGFDNLNIQRFPQLQIATDRKFGIYRPDDSVAVTVEAKGVEADAQSLNLVLLDHEGRVFRRSATDIDHQTNPPSATWSIGRLGPGHYHVVASVAEPSRSPSGRLANRSPASPHQLGTETSFSVLNPSLDGPPHGPFGWSIKDPIPDDISPPQYADYLNDAGVTWLKYPCWINGDDTRKAERLSALLGRLQDDGIRPVGRLDRPPPHHPVAALARGREAQVAAAFFRDASVWQPELEPIMNRLTLKVRHWQLGADDDFSFLEQSKLKSQVAAIRSGLQGFGQPLDLTIPWPWLEETLPPRESSWQAVYRSSMPPLSADELKQSLQQVRRDDSGGPDTWLAINPISRDRYDTRTRAADLVRRMAAVRAHRVAAAFISDPHDEQNGILHPDGHPSELFLPWRTASRLLGNRRYAGSLRLPSGASNEVFTGGGSAVWMVWSPEPITEEIYLGENVEQIDLWGRAQAVPTVARGSKTRHQIKMGPMPTFIVGVNPQLMEFRMSVELPHQRLDSLLGQMQALGVQFANPTRESLVGAIRITPPRSWRIAPESQAWELLPGRGAQVPFEVVLSNTAQVGSIQLPIEFDLETDPPQSITVHRRMSVGPTGLTITASTKLLRNGELRILMEMTNLSGREQSYDCLLFPPPGRQYQMRYITIPPGETATREFYWPQGAELIGKRMLLRAVEQDGNRILNYPIELVR